MELAQAALLRPLVAEHGAVGEDLERQILGQTAGDERARDASRGLGAHRDHLAAAIGKSVHLLRDHVGGVAERALEDFRRLEDRHRDFEIAVALGDGARGLDHMAMAPAVVGQKIACAANRLQCRHERTPKEALLGRGRLGGRIGALGLDLGGLLLDQLDQMIDDIAVAKHVMLLTV